MWNGLFELGNRLVMRSIDTNLLARAHHAPPYPLHPTRLAVGDANGLCCDVWILIHRDLLS
jgi:hypothetical protein